MEWQARLLSSAVALTASLPAVAGKADSPVALRAKGLIEGHAAAVRRANTDSFTVKDVIVDRDGNGHVRFDRPDRGLRVSVN